MMSCVAGRCTGCQAWLWRTYPDAATGAPVLLWPSPASLYARVVFPEGVAVGIGYCETCVLNGHASPGGAVIAYERAPVRYQYWFSPAYGAQLRAQVQEPERRLAEPMQQALIAQWEQDVAEVTHG